MASVFSTMSRYVPSAKRNPREDSLTQAFQATIEAVGDQGLVEVLLETWKIDCGFEICDFRTQTQKHPRGSRKRVDLEIEVRSAASENRSFVVWIEVKHGSGLSGDDQLRSYAKALEKDPGAESSSLVFLPPWGFQLTSKEPAGLIKSNWQQVAEAVNSWLEDDCRDPSAKWLGTEFTKFLKEEKLYMTKSVTAETFSDLERASAAVKTINDVLEVSETLLEEFAKARPELEFKEKASRKRAKWPSFWKTFGAKNPNGYEVLRHSWFDWCLREVDHSSPIVVAGITFANDFDSMDLKEVFAEVGDSENSQIEYRYEDGYYRLSAQRSLDTLIATPGTPHEQAKRLSDWVEKVYLVIFEIPELSGKMRA